MRALVGIAGQENVAQFACLAAREILVLTICLNTGPMDDVGFEEAMAREFVANSEQNCEVNLI